MEDKFSDQNILSLIQELEEEERKSPSSRKYSPEVMKAALKITIAARERANGVVTSFPKLREFIKRKLGYDIPRSTLQEWYTRYKTGTLELRE